MIQAFIENPILLLFVVAGIGYGAGSIRIRGTNLGVAAVLFAGLLFGGLSPDLHIPESIIFLGLAIFVYSIGLSSGPGFFANFRQRGFRDIFFVMAMIAISAAIAAGLFFVFDFSATTTSGVFAGSTTNTPALAGLLDIIRNLPNLNQKEALEMSEQAVIGYSLTYPMGIFGTMVAIQLLTKWLKIDLKKEEETLRKDYPVKQEIINKTVKITNSEFVGISIRDLKRKYKWKIVFGRIQRNEVVTLSSWDSTFELNDRVVIVGDKLLLNEIAMLLGEISSYIPENLSEYVSKRIFVSNPNIAGERLSTLNLSEKFAAIIATIRRGDIDLLANGNTIIELGDQVHFIARQKDVPKISAFFGDSIEALSKINLLSFGLGMALGLLLGMVSLQLPGGLTFQLGFAGGVIIVALVLGALRRTGPIVWTLPYGANLTLRQIGLILMLAGIGINSGHTFMSTISEGSGGLIFLAGSIISFLTAAITLVVGYKMLKIPFSFLLGMVSTQPAILDFVLEKTNNKLPIIGYTLMLPVSLIIKVLYVQILFAILN